MTANSNKPPSIFFKSVSRKTTLAISRAAAGAGVLGLLGFVGLFIVATAFFITIFCSSRHLISAAAFLQETLVSLRRYLQVRRDSSEGETFGPLEPQPIIKLVSNPLSRDLQTILSKKKDFDYLEYMAHAYYVECHELYDYSSAHLEFVAGAMPLFGLIGTIIGLIGMFDTLGADVTVEYLAPQLALALKTTLYGAIFSSIYKIIASRFEQRLKALEYDFETFCRALQVLAESDVEIEVQS